MVEAALGTLRGVADELQREHGIEISLPGPLGGIARVGRGRGDRSRGRRGCRLRLPTGARPVRPLDHRPGAPCSAPLRGSQHQRQRGRAGRGVRPVPALGGAPRDHARDPVRDRSVAAGPHRRPDPRPARLGDRRARDQRPAPPAGLEPARDGLHPSARRYRQGARRPRAGADARPDPGHDDGDRGTRGARHGRCRRRVRARRGRAAKAPRCAPLGPRAVRDDRRPAPRAWT